MTITKHVTTRLNCLKAAIAEIWQTRLSFPKVLEPRFPHFFSSVFSFFHPVTKSVSVDCFLVPLVLKFDCYCKIGTLCELVCEQLFSLFQQNSCVSLRFIGIEKLFALTCIAYASARDIKSMNSNADTLWTFSKRLLAFNSPDYRSRISKKGWNFFFFLKKFSSRERNCCKVIPWPCWMDDSEYFKDCEYKTTDLQICAKKGDISQVTWSERMTFS